MFLGRMLMLIYLENCWKELQAKQTDENCTRLPATPSEAGDTNKFTEDLKRMGIQLRRTCLNSTTTSVVGVSKLVGPKGFVLTWYCHNQLNP
jgi:hypothetical protein